MVILINTFTVHGAPERFEEVFTSVSDHMRRQPGFLNHRLVRAADGSTYVNVVEWESPQLLRQAVEHRDFTVFERRLAEVATSSSVLHQPVLSCERGAGMSTTPRPL